MIRFIGVSNGTIYEFNWRLISIYERENLIVFQDQRKK